MSADVQTSDRCKVCGAFIRAQGDYRYCPMQGMARHIMQARATDTEGER